MNWKEKAINIMKVFASGVNCPKWDRNTIKKTMFHPYCERVAIDKKKKEIDEEVVREYILEKHNSIVVEEGREEEILIKAIKYCMIRPVKTDKGWVAVHGKTTVMTITEKEAEFLEKQNQELLKSLQ